MKLNDSLLYHIHGLECSVERFAAAFFGDDGRINYAQYKLLVAVHEGEQDSVGTIAAWLGLSAPTVSHLVRVLTTKGYLTVVVAEDDTRRKIISVTASGKKLLSRLTPKFEASIENALQPLTKNEHHQLIELIEKTREGFERVANT